MIINQLLQHKIVACFLLALTAGLHGQASIQEVDPFAEQEVLSKQIRVQVEYIDMSQEQMIDLLFGAKPAANDVELRKQVGQLVKDGKATVMETMLCIARSGHRARAESIEEVTYPTEYEAAQLPHKTASDAKEEAGKTPPIPKDSAIGPTPTAFETRNVGTTIEIEAVLSHDHKHIDLILAPEIVYHVGNQVWAEWKSEHGNVPIQMPIFYVVRINTSVVLADGEPMFLSAISPKSKDGKVDFNRKLMVFIRADVINPAK